MTFWVWLLFAYIVVVSFLTVGIYGGWFDKWLKKWVLKESGKKWE